MTTKSLSRRHFLQGTAGSVALAAGGLPFLGAQQAFAADLASQELRTVGLSVTDRKSTRLNSSHLRLSRMPSSA